MSQTEDKFQQELDLALLASLLEQSNLMNREEEEEAQLRQILELSLKETSHPTIPSKITLERSESVRSEAEELAAAIEASMQDLQLPSQLKLTSVNKYITSIPIPNQKCKNYLKDLRHPLGQRYGVHLDVFHNYRLQITAETEEAMIIAKHELSILLKDSKSLLQAVNEAKDQKIHIFIDFSNLFIHAQYPPVSTPPLPPPPPSFPTASSSCFKPSTTPITLSRTRDVRIRLKCPAIDQLLRSGRTALRKVVIGSKTNQKHHYYLWKKWKSLDYQSLFIDRQKGQKEQLVDNAIIAEIQRSILTSPIPQTIVLVTGDGNDNHGWVCFHEVIQISLHGWKVELWTWQECTNPKYYELVESYQGTNLFTIYFLDPYRENITFLFDTHYDRDHSKAFLKVGEGRRIIASNEMLTHEQEEEEEEEEDDDWANCPITCVIFEDPVKTCYGHIYERRAIIEWIEKKQTCPMTSQRLLITDLQEVSVDFKQRLNLYKAKIYR